MIATAMCPSALLESNHYPSSSSLSSSQWQGRLDAVHFSRCAKAHSIQDFRSASRSVSCKRSLATATCSNQTFGSKKQNTRLSLNQRQVQVQFQTEPASNSSKQAVHVLRHEIKNGVLAALAIAETLQEAYYKQQQSAASTTSRTASSVDQHFQELTASLDDLLRRTVDCATVVEVGHGDYCPTVEAVDVQSMLSKSTAASVSQSMTSTTSTADVQDNTSSRFPVLTTSTATPELLPELMLDPSLVRTIHKNAVSNACRYGKDQGTVTTCLKYDQTTQIFSMQVENLPGKGRHHLMQQIKSFPSLSPLSCGGCKIGSGLDLLQKCAQAMPQGRCDMHFREDKTVLTFQCQAQVSPAWKQQQQMQMQKLQEQQTQTDLDEGSFHLPQNTWVIVVEDSAIQRKLLNRFLQRSGIPSEKCLILGETPQEIFQFVQVTRTLIREHQMDYVLVIADEHLDIVEGGAVSQTISGSSTIETLRQSLTPWEESRLLSLVRSANDSQHEQRLYQSRAHGFLSKGPMKQGKLLEAIKPFWKRRFQSSTVSQLQQTSTATHN